MRMNWKRYIRSRTIKGTVSEFPCQNLRKTRKISVRTAGILAELLTEHLQNTSLDYYNYSNVEKKPSSLKIEIDNNIALGFVMEIHLSRDFYF